MSQFIKAQDIPVTAEAIVCIKTSEGEEVIQFKKTDRAAQMAYNVALSAGNFNEITWRHLSNRDLIHGFMMW